MTNTQMKLMGTAKQCIRTVFDNGIRFQWTHAVICEELNKVIPYDKLPIYVLEYLRGYGDCLMDLIWSKYVIFTYEIDGKRLAIDSDEYYKARRIFGYTIGIKTGQHSWRSDLSKPFTLPLQLPITSAPALNGELCNTTSI